ncbi:Fiber [Gossypium australe]|uniref:Fiber n=1 Tax=Gossypium australe TaxID=47621 RepID=A0A5B6W9V1_9ROSI|nr:Fiber [Gossypium australe]
MRLVRSRVRPCLGYGLGTKLRSLIRPYLGYGIGIEYENRIRPYLGYGIGIEYENCIRPYMGYGIDNRYEIPYKTISGIWHRHLKYRLANSGIVRRRSSESHYQPLFGIAKLDLF